MNTMLLPRESAHVLDRAREVLRKEAAAILELCDRLDGAFVKAVETILAGSGKVVVTGIGKSGHVGRKVAATMASTGTPAFFVHPAEANHGDLGMIGAADVVVAISYSGETGELLTIVPLLKRLGTPLIAITGNAASTLARDADVHLDARVNGEADPLGLAPTSSTTAALALGDALAMALLEARGFGPEDFARSHPGGALGRRLLIRVRDVMHAGERLPVVPLSATLPEALLEMSRKGLGMTAVVDDAGVLAGVFTDGDLRRTLERAMDVRCCAVQDVMGRHPHTIDAEKLAAEAVSYMERFKINGLIVVDAQRRPVGALNMHDLFRAKVI